MRYKAIVSYSHLANPKLGPAPQAGRAELALLPDKLRKYARMLVSTAGVEDLTGLEVAQ